MDEERQLVLGHVNTSVARSIGVDNVAAHVFGSKSSEEGHILIEFIGLPKTEQHERTSSRA